MAATYHYDRFMAGTQRPKVVKLRPTASSIQPLHYNWGGLDDVYLVSGFERIPTDEGDDIIIQDMDGLHRAIAEHLVLTKKSLSGKEVRFLRGQMDLSQRDLGALMRTTDQSVARWEKEDVRIPGPAQMFLRVLYLASVSGKIDVRELAETLTDADEVATERQVFAESGGKWRAVAA